MSGNRGKSESADGYANSLASCCCCCCCCRSEYEFVRNRFLRGSAPLAAEGPGVLAYVSDTCLGTKEIKFGSLGHVLKEFNEVVSSSRLWRYE
jgi:hypothetical protein